VIPILIDGARVPRGNQLPKDLEALLLRNSLDVHHASFHDDMAKQIKALPRCLTLVAADLNVVPRPLVMPTADH
jgi:hypothetical protein